MVQDEALSGWLSFVRYRQVPSSVPRPKRHGNWKHGRRSKISVASSYHFAFSPTGRGFVLRRNPPGRDYSRGADGRFITFRSARLDYAEAPAEAVPD